MSNDLIGAAYQGMGMAMARIAQKDGTTVNNMRIPKEIDLDNFNSLAEVKAHIDTEYKQYAQDNDMLGAHGGTFNCHMCTYTHGVNCPEYCSSPMK